MAETSVISSKLEDYLETIFNLMAERRVARVSEIAERMGVQMPTVTGALKHLAEHDLVNYRPYQFVTLTPDGVRIARGLIRRHDALRAFLLEVLALPEDTAERDACGMEHALSEQARNRLIRFLEFIRSCPRAGPGLIERFCRASEGGNCGPESCEECIAACLDQVRDPNPNRANPRKERNP